MTSFRPLGRTGVQVSPLTLGAMMFGAWGNPDHDESIRIIHRALDAGINVIDTADVYARGESEEIVGKAIKGRRDDIVLATKFHGAMSDDDPNQGGNSRRWIIRSVEDSLRRLQTDHIDLYQVHRPRPEIDIEDTLSALSRPRARRQDPLRRHLDLPALADRRGAVGRPDRHLERPATEQPPYSILAREVERDVLPTAEKYGLGILPWSPLAGGWLSGRYRRGEAPGVVEPRGAPAGPPRPGVTGEQGEAGGGPRAPGPGRRGRGVADPPGAGLRAQAPGRVVGDHRPAHARAARVAARRGEDRPPRRRARPHRRDRAARHDDQRGRPGSMRHPRWSSPRCGEAESAKTPATR